MKCEFCMGDTCFTSVSHNCRVFPICEGCLTHFEGATCETSSLSIDQGEMGESELFEDA